MKINFINHGAFYCIFKRNIIKIKYNNDLIIIINELDKNNIKYKIKKDYHNNYIIKINKNIISYSDNHYSKKHFNKSVLNKDISQIVIS